jgi:hypothetical protein
VAIGAIYLLIITFDVWVKLNSAVLSDIISLTIILKQRMEQEHSGRLLLIYCWSCRFHSVPGEHTSSVYFGGHRSYLPLDHYLRCLGKTKNGTGTFREAFINVKQMEQEHSGRLLLM